MNFHIVQAAVNQHPNAFDELAFLLQATLRDLGHTCTHARNRWEPAARNILLGCNLIPAGKLPAGVDYIAYQLEQLFSGSPWWTKLEPVLRGAAEVWDYSLSNAAFLAHHSIAARYLPIGYHPTLRRIQGQSWAQQALFYGSLSPRRRKILDQIRRAGLSVLALSSAYGKFRDAHIAASGLCLNLHYQTANVFEAVRVAYLLNNSRLVLSECSDSYPYAGVDLPIAAAEQIPGRCIELLADDPERLGRLCGEQFADLYPMHRLLGEMLT